MAKGYRVVLVHWVDSATAGRWHPAGSVITPVDCFSVGFVQKQTKKYICLIQSYGDGEVGNLLTVPMACVVAVKELE